MTNRIIHAKPFPHNNNITCILWGHFPTFSLYLFFAKSNQNKYKFYCINRHPKGWRFFCCLLICTDSKLQKNAIRREGLKILRSRKKVPLRPPSKNTPADKDFRHNLLISNIKP